MRTDPRRRSPLTRPRRSLLTRPVLQSDGVRWTYSLRLSLLTRRHF